MRIIIAGILGGLAMFLWAAVAHTVLPLGQIGVHTLNDETVTVAAISAATGDGPGIYLFPSGNSMGAARQTPTGFLAYSPASFAMNPTTLGGETGLEIIQSLIGAVLLSVTALSGYLRRAVFVALLGVAVALSTSGSYWIWYNFPADYTLGYIFTDLVRYLVAGLVIAAIVKPRAALAG